ncbi:MAG: RNA polymerase sigma factor [Opitutales bacterium]
MPNTVPHFGCTVTAKLVAALMVEHESTLRPASTTAPSIDIDSACLNALADGDQEAFTPIVERWQSPLIHFFYRSLGNRPDAEDLAQETFLELYRSARRYQARGTFQAFLFTLARRRLIDLHRKRSRRPLQLIDPTDPFSSEPVVSYDTSPEIQEAFYTALENLPEKQRSAILLRQQQELSYEEIAEALHASISAVKTWIHRARQELRHSLQDYYDKP